jgi:hypothetical protein
MATLDRIRVTWTGFPGAPGYSTLYCLDANLHTGPLRAFFDAIKTNLPNNVTITVATAGDKISDVDGAVTGAWTASTLTPVVGLGSSTQYSGASGAVVLWRTSTVVDGRRPIGKTYLVPLATAAYDNGSLATSVKDAIATAANNMIVAAGASPMIWHRPLYNNATPPVRIRDGSSLQVTTATVPDLCAVMRSRRT